MYHDVGWYSPGMRADEARPGDVVLDGGGKCWMRGQGQNSWFTFDGPVMFFGEWKPEYGPLGRLTLRVRDGKPAGPGGDHRAGGDVEG